MRFIFILLLFASGLACADQVFRVEGRRPYANIMFGYFVLADKPLNVERLPERHKRDALRYGGVTGRSANACFYFPAVSHGDSDLSRKSAEYLRRGVAMWRMKRDGEFEVLYRPVVDASHKLVIRVVTDGYYGEAVFSYQGKTSSSQILVGKGVNFNLEECLNRLSES